MAMKTRHLAIHTILAISLLLLASCTCAKAALEWEYREYKTEATPYDEEVFARFPFKNTGGTTVTITSVKAVCGCTTAKLDKTTYQPGESGEIAARFKIGVRMGTQRSPITVQTDDPSQKKLGLYVVTEIPVVAKPKPSFAYWKKGEPLEAKELPIETDPRFPLTELKAVAMNGGVAVTVVPDGANYRVRMQPTTPGRTVAGLVQMEAVLKDGGSKRQNLYVRVDGDTAEPLPPGPNGKTAAEMDAPDPDYDPAIHK